MGLPVSFVCVCVCKLRYGDGILLLFFCAHYHVGFVEFQLHKNYLVNVGFSFSVKFVCGGAFVLS